MIAFDSDVLIYAANVGHPLGSRVAGLFSPAPRADGEPPVGIGSVLLLPEVLSKAIRDGAEEELVALTEFLARVDLLPLDRETAELAVSLAAAYRLRAADATHLATAVNAGADRFLTNNQRDFPQTIAEIEVVYPQDLPDVTTAPMWGRCGQRLDG